MNPRISFIEDGRSGVLNGGAVGCGDVILFPGFSPDDGGLFVVTNADPTGVDGLPLRSEGDEMVFGSRTEYRGNGTPYKVVGAVPAEAAVNAERAARIQERLSLGLYDGGEIVLEAQLPDRLRYIHIGADSERW